MLKAAEPEGFEACLFYFRRYEPVSTVTTVSKLVDFLETTFSGDLMDSLTYFERRVASWEHETFADFIKIGVVIKGLERRFSGSFALQHCWHDRIDEICKIDRKH